MKVEVVADNKNMKGDIDLECVLTEYYTERKVDKFLSVQESELVKQEGSKLYFEMNAEAKIPGLCNFAYRVFPKYPDMAHRMNFNYMH